MKLARYFALPVVVLGFLVSTNAQQNSTQVNVSSVVTCVSTGDQRQHCPANTNAGIVVLRQSSETSCLLGRNWGYDAQGVWVSEGCGGEFATGSTSRSAAIPAEAKALAEPVEQQAELATVTTGTNPKFDYTGLFNPYGSIRTIVSISAPWSAGTGRCHSHGYQFQYLRVNQGCWHGGVGHQPCTKRDHIQCGRNHGARVRRDQSGNTARFRGAPWFPRRRFRPVWASDFRQTELDTLRHNELHDGSLQCVRWPVDRNLCRRNGWWALLANRDARAAVTQADGKI